MPTPRRSFRVCAHAWAVGWFGWALVQGAQAQSLPVEPSVDTGGFVGFASTRMPGPWRPDFAFSVGYEAEPLRRGGAILVRPEAALGNLGTSPREQALARLAAGETLEHRLSTTLQARLGLGGRGALWLALPVVTLERGAGGEAGVGDGFVGAAVRVWGAPTDARGDTPEGAAVSVQAGTSLPWGQDATLTTSGRPRLHLGATADMRAFGVVAGVHGAYDRRFDDPVIPVGRDRLELAFATQIPVPLVSRVAREGSREHVVLDLATMTRSSSWFDARTTALEGRVMWRLKIADYALSLGSAVGLVRALDTPIARAFVAVQSSPRPRDEDVDGVSDGRDACPQLAEDNDGFEDDDGCPEPDNDGDGILDEDDLCPLEAANYDLDADGDGCNDRS